MSNTIKFSSFSSVTASSNRQSRLKWKQQRAVVRASTNKNDDDDASKNGEEEDNNQATTTRATRTTTQQQPPLFDAQILQLKSNIYALAATTSRGAEASADEKEKNAKENIRVEQIESNTDAGTKRINQRPVGIGVHGYVRVQSFTFLLATRKGVE